MAKASTTAARSYLDRMIMLWLYRHGWESPDWGKLPIDQINIASTIHELAAELSDVESKKAVQAAAKKAMASAARGIAQG
jgi:hypothetical protein